MELARRSAVFYAQACTGAKVIVGTATVHQDRRLLVATTRGPKVAFQVMSAC